MRRVEACRIARRACIVLIAREPHGVFGTHHSHVVLLPATRRTLHRLHERRELIPVELGARVLQDDAHVLDLACGRRRIPLERAPRVLHDHALAQLRGALCADQLSSRRQILLIVVGRHSVECGTANPELCCNACQSRLHG